MKKTLLLLVLLTVLVVGIATAQSDKGILNPEIPYYKEYAQALQICAMQPTQFRSVIVQVMNDECQTREQIIKYLNDWQLYLSEAFPLIREYIARAVTDGYDDARGGLIVTTMYTGNVAALIQVLASIRMQDPQGNNYYY